jgi:hypothetical protein
MCGCGSKIEDARLFKRYDKADPKIEVTVSQLE